MISLTLLLPILVIAALAVPRASIRAGACSAAPLAVAPAIVLTVSTPTAALDLPWLLMGTSLQMDDIARPLLFVAAVLYGAALIAVAWTRRRAPALTAFLLASYVGTAGAYLAADAVVFYLAFAVMSFSAAGLVIHHRTPQAHRATAVYLVMTVLSETALLGALLLVVGAGGALLADAHSAVAAADQPGLIVGLLIFGFGVKAGLVPLHLWLPLAHPAAPPAASAVLSGVMVKVGVVGWLRFLPPADSVSAFAWILLVLALAGAFLPVAAGLLQDDPKVILAYSTISQLGFITAVLAAGVLAPGIHPATTSAVALYAVHHGLVKGALFIGVPVVKKHGRGALSAVTLLGMTWAGLALAGAPWTSGAFAKYDAKYAVEDVHLGVAGLADLLPLVATGSTLLLLRLAWVMWHGERSAGRADAQFGAWLVLCVLGLTVPWWIGASWLGLSAPQWTSATLWDMAWPILLALAAGVPVWLLASRGRLPAAWPASDGSVIPPGDAVVLAESAVGAARKYGGAGLKLVHDRTGRVADGWDRGWAAAAALTRQGVEAVETRARVWTLTGIAVLTLLAVLLLPLLVNGGGAQ